MSDPRKGRDNIFCDFWGKRMTQGVEQFSNNIICELKFHRVNSIQFHSIQGLPEILLCIVVL